MPNAKLKWGSNEEQKGWQGLNNAAINSFNSNIINSFIREMFQNSNDARDKTLPRDPATGRARPLHIVINYKNISRSQFPDFDGFMELLDSVKSAPLNKKHGEFFKNAKKAMGNKDSIKLFVYEDFNTTGLSGSDDDDESTFSACILSEGISVGKEKTAGGSYGIGKNSIFGFSKLRTVFYSSLNIEKEFIFQGRAKLATYYGNNGKKYSDKIFCGDGKTLSSVRKIDDLSAEHQQLFKRTKPGLSQFAICPADHENWVEEFAEAILRNYWLLLDKGELLVELKQDDKLVVTLNDKNLEPLFKKYFDPETFEMDYSINPYGNPYEFYKCYKAGQCAKAKIEIIGNSRFFYSELENNKTNAVAYIRNNMVIYAQSVFGFGSINYSGVFICDNDEGNSVLRDMEPPTHDSFKPERLDEKSEKYNARDGKKILDGIKNVIKASLQTISDKYKQAAQDIPWLDEFLKSITGAAGAGSGTRTNTRSEKETPEKMGSKFKSTVSFKTKEKNTLVYDPDGTIPGVGGSPVDPGTGHPKVKRPHPGSKRGTQPVTKTKIKSRTYITNRKKSINGKEYVEYKMFLSSEKADGKTDITLSQKGDSGNVVCFEIAEVKDSKGKSIAFSEERNKTGEPTGYHLKSVSFPSELSFMVNEPYKSSFKVVSN